MSRKVGYRSEGFWSWQSGDVMIVPTRSSSVNETLSDWVEPGMPRHLLSQHFKAERLMSLRSALDTE